MKSPVAVITEIFMPSRSGIDLCIDIRREFPKLKIIAMSAATEGLRTEPVKRLFNGILAKPYAAGTARDHRSTILEVNTMVEPRMSLLDMYFLTGVFINEAVLSEALGLIHGCQYCDWTPELTFDYLLDALTGCGPPTEYVLCRAAKCPQCGHDIGVETFVRAI